MKKKMRGNIFITAMIIGCVIGATGCGKITKAQEQKKQNKFLNDFSNELYNDFASTMYFSDETVIKGVDGRDYLKVFKRSYNIAHIDGKTIYTDVYSESVGLYDVSKFEMVYEPIYTNDEVDQFIETGEMQIEAKSHTK